MLVMSNVESERLARSVEDVVDEEDEEAPREPTHRPPSASIRRRVSVANIRAVCDRFQKYLTEAGTSDGSGGPVSTSSPVNKRRGFSGRKWLPPPLRKLSQGKVEKTSSNNTDRPSKSKSTNDKSFKLPSGGEMGNKPATPSEHAVATAAPRAVSAPAPAPCVEHNGEDADEDVELPPPMKPITEPTILTSSNVDETQKREQHTENQERNSLLSRDSKASSDFPSTGEEEVEEGTEDSEDTEQPSRDSVVTGRDGPAEALYKREYVIRELVETERDYVHDLGLVAEGYLPLMRDMECDIPMPEDLRKGKDKMVFGNLEAMYEWHRDFFLKALERCVLQPQELGPLFKRYERKLHMYVVYCQNKPKSEYIVSEYETYFEEVRQRLGHKLQLCDLLIKPVQRIMKYQLLLRDVFKYTERANLAAETESLRQALQVMHVVPKAANDMMDVGRLQGFDGKITAQGKLLLHGPLNCCEGISSFNVKGKELQVFLFEQNIIFSEAVGKKTQFTSPVYIHKAHIQVNKMSLEENADDSEGLKFVIRSTDPRKTNLAYVCQAANSDSRDEWVSTIKNILQTQKDFLKAIQSPIAYQKELTKEVSSPDLSSTLSYPSMRKTMSQPPPSPQPPSPSSPGTNSPNKNKLNLFEGFRNTLRSSKPKIDIQEIERGTQELSVTRRWSEVGAMQMGEPGIVGVGSVVKATADFRSAELSLNRGDVVQIWAMDVTRGYLVRHQGCEGWIPAQVIHQHSEVARKAWPFRFRKPRRGERRSFDGGNVSPVSNNVHKQGLILEYPPPAPEFLEQLADISAPAGTSAELRCRLHPACDVDVTWRKTPAYHDASGEVIRSEGRYKVSLTSDGEACLVIDGCRPADSGRFTCTACNDAGSSSTDACLTVVGSSYGVPTQPCAQVLAGTSVLLTWEATGEFLIECCRHRHEDWLPVGNNVVVRGPSHVVDGLTHGETYCFRLVSPRTRVQGPPSTPITIQVTDAGRWQQEQFRRRYVEMEELGRGRVSVVVRAKDRGTGQEVAAKQVSRRRQGHHVTRAEYALLSRLQHPGIVRTLVLFNNAPTPGADTIVMELVDGPHLFPFICREAEYNEKTVCLYTRQLLSALAYLHDQQVAHLDVKPENIMVDTTLAASPMLKLIDFGDALGSEDPEVMLPPANLEFAAPELVIGQPATCRADMWSVGVFLYAFLSGLSPFLDDSLEETTANILKCDYCFPREYFASVSNESRDLIIRLLTVNPAQRIDARACLEFPWFKEVPKMTTIPSSRLMAFVDRRQSLVRPLFMSLTSQTSQES